MQQIEPNCLYSKVEIFVAEKFSHLRPMDWNGLLYTTTNRDKVGKPVSKDRPSIHDGEAMTIPLTTASFRYCPAQESDAFRLRTAYVSTYTSETPHKP